METVGNNELGGIGWHIDDNGLVPLQQVNNVTIYNYS
jgi:hypothetical protein